MQAPLSDWALLIQPKWALLIYPKMASAMVLTLVVAADTAFSIVPMASASDFVTSAKCERIAARNLRRQITARGRHIDMACTDGNVGRVIRHRGNA